MRTCRGLLLVMFVLALAFGNGRAVASAATDMRYRSQESDMVLIMTTMASDRSMSGMCDKCIKTESDKHACIPGCAAVQAVAPVSDIPRVFVRARIEPVAEQIFHGSIAPPDPPPPKLNVPA